MESLTIPVIYGMITGTIGTCCGVYALYRTVSKDRIRLRVMTQMGVSEIGECFWLTIFNDGREIVVKSISVKIYGKLNDDVNRLLAESRQNYSPKPTDIVSEVGETVCKNNRYEYKQNFPWSGMSRLNQPWCVMLEFASGQVVEIPSWRLGHDGPIKMRTKLFRPAGKIVFSLGRKSFEIQTLQNRMKNKRDE